MTAPSAVSFKDLRLGMFVHYVYCGHPYRYGTVAQRADGSVAATLDELAEELDVQDLAQVAASLHAEYLIFTAWHANMNALYPSQVLTRMLPGHSARRDVVRDLLAALKPYGIRLYLYVHPSDGHDFTPEDQARVGWNDGTPYARWNDFINAVFDELLRRYRGEVAGYWIDGGQPPQIVQEMDRLRATMRQADPVAEVIQNEGFRGQARRWADYGSRETVGFPYRADKMQVAMVVTATWWAERSYVMLPPEVAFQYTVLQAAVEGAAGGGVAWSAGPYARGQWEPGVRAFFQALGDHVRPVANSILGTRPSRAFPTSEGTPLIKGGLCVATETPDGATTYIHVLRPPAERTVHLSPPADGRTFAAATSLRSGDSVTLLQDQAGVHLTLGTSEVWDVLDTVIVLHS